MKLYIRNIINYSRTTTEILACIKPLDLETVQRNQHTRRIFPGVFLWEIGSRQLKASDPSENVKIWSMMRKISLDILYDYV